MNRRDFLRHTGVMAGGACLWLSGASLAAEDQAPGLKAPSAPAPGRDDAQFLKPAMFFDKLEGKSVRCRLCPRECQVPDGQRGRCRVRENRGGQYMTLVHGRAVALNNDPIEKKPFNHFLPGTMVLSVAAAGCNISCKFCQNWQISQFAPEEVEARPLPPEKLVDLAKSHKIPSLAFTYSEPTIYYEYMYDSARLARENSIKAVVVSNGFIQPAAVKNLVPHLAAYKIDLKAFTEDFYRDYCEAKLKPVMTTLETLKSLGLWFEIVNLILPTANDSPKDISAMARWIKANLGPDVPLHFTRFHPMYKIKNLPPTPVSTLEECHKAAKAEGLNYVYLGNVPGHSLGHTYCPKCQHVLIKRTSLWAVDVDLDQGRCPKCQTNIPGVWA